MKHAKRMVLVPEDVLNRYEQKQKIETFPITSNMMHQDTAMSEILQSTDISDAEKQKLYNANMESYLSLRRQKDDQIPTVRIAQDAEQKSKEKAPLSDADVIGHLPVTMRPKAATLLRRLKTRPDVISWDDSGQVKVDGKEIPDSNISDLASDAMGHVRILIPRERRNSFADCQRLMYPKILQETRKDGIRFKWAVRLARKRLFLRHRHRDHRHQHHHVQVPRNISVVYSEDRRRNQNNGDPY